MTIKLTLSDTGQILHKVQVEKEVHYCPRCQEETSHLVVNSGKENCYAVCQICSHGRSWE